MTDHEKILDKIRKLKALANPDQNTSENEIASALKIARKLMLEHGINEAETTVQIQDEELGGSFVSPLGTKNRQIWLITLAFAIDTYFDCKHLLNTKYYSNTGKTIELSFIFYGPREQAEIASYCFTSVYNQVWALSNAYDPPSSPFYRPKAFSRIAKREYREGLSKGLLDRCERLKKQEQESMQSSAITALAVRSEAIADEWFAKYEKQTGKKIEEQSLNSKRHTVGPQHFAKGMRDSEKLSLSKAALKA